MICDFCDYERDDVKEYGNALADDGKVRLCRVCAHLRGTDPTYGRSTVTPSDVLYAVARLYHALGVVPPEEPE